MKSTHPAAVNWDLIIYPWKCKLTVHEKPGTELSDMNLTFSSNKSPNSSIKDKPDVLRPLTFL